MARNEARLRAAIWNDDDFLALSRSAQGMYMFLISQPDLSHAGVLPLRLNRWADTAAGLTVAQVRADLEELAGHWFIIVDERADEVLVRSLLRGDKVYQQPKVLQSARAALEHIKSVPIRLTLIAELKRISLLQMHDDSVAIVANMLRDLGAGTDDDPSGKGVRKGTPKGIGYPSGYPSPSGVSGDAETPAESTAADDDERSSMDDGHDDEPVSISAGEKGSRKGIGNPLTRAGARPARVPFPLTPNQEQDPPVVPPAKTKRGTRLPDDFSVTDGMKAWARQHAPLAGTRDHDAFCDHWRGQSGQRAVKSDWIATWRNWMRRTQENREQQARPRGAITTRHLDNLTPEERAARNPFSGAVHASQVLAEGAS